MVEMEVVDVVAVAVVGMRIAVSLVCRARTRRAYIGHGGKITCVFNLSTTDIRSCLKPSQYRTAEGLALGS